MWESINGHWSTLGIKKTKLGLADSLFRFLLKSSQIDPFFSSAISYRHQATSPTPNLTFDKSKITQDAMPAQCQTVRRSIDMKANMLEMYQILILFASSPTRAIMLRVGQTVSAHIQ